ncbi:hypothetical protein BJ165DRAFT_1608737, partial [Panaeolus papilionaceus]
MSRAFVPLCRPYIFRHAKFGPYGPGNEASKTLARIIEDQPHILKHVKELTFDLDTNDYSMHGTRSDYDCSEDAISDSERSSLCSDTTPEYTNPNEDDVRTIALVKQLLPNVKILSVIHTLCDATDLHGTCLNSRCRWLSSRTLSTFSNSSTLTRLALEQVVVPLDVLIRLPSLEVTNITFSLFDVSDLPYGVEDGTEDGSVDSDGNSKQDGADGGLFVGRSPLRSISLRGVHNFFRTMFSFFAQLRSITLEGVSEDNGNLIFLKIPFTTYLARLESLSISHSEYLYYFFDIDELEKGGDKVFPSLKSLKVDDIMCDYQGLDDLHNGFQHIQVLESLFLSTRMGDICNLNLDPVIIGCRNTFKNLKIETNYGGHYDESLIRILCDALTAVRGDNVLETIDLTLVTYCTGPAEGGWMKVPSFEHWKRLDSLLMKNRAVDFPCLRKVKVCVNFDEVESPEVGSVSDCWIGQRFLEKPLQRLMATKEIEFSCSHYPADDNDLDF